MRFRDLAFSVFRDCGDLPFKRLNDTDRAALILAYADENRAKVDADVQRALDNLYREFSQEAA